MSEDRTTPMRQPDWSRSGKDADQQETMFSEQENVTPPTIPLGDQGQAGWKQAPSPGFVRTSPSVSTTPPPFPGPRPPAGPPAAKPAAEGQGQTMIISERPTPVFAWLVVVDGPDRGSIGVVHTLRADATTLGRVAGNHIVLRDETCSGQHARIRVEAKEGQAPIFALYDMGSRNGTFVGDRENYKEESSRKYRHELQDGDYLLVGETTLVFKRL
jgi:pSer/pThr/pTyr-binding forkhead associated (FHA) protein